MKIAAMMFLLVTTALAQMSPGIQQPVPKGGMNDRRYSYHIDPSTEGMMNLSGEGRGCTPTAGDDCTPRYTYGPQGYDSNAIWAASLPSPTSLRLTVLPEYRNAVEVQSKDGMTVVRMQDDDYTHLTAMRQAVVDEEKRLAVVYGAILERQLIKKASPICTWTCEFDQYREVDHYEFHGQFLLIQKTGK